jgi:hypothetical protein
MPCATNARLASITNPIKDMKLLLVLLAANLALAADWDTMRQIPTGQKMEIATRDGKNTRGTFVSLSGDAATIREPSGERSVPRTEIRRVRVYDSGRRVRRGLLWTAVGAGVGAVGGAAACPGCPNEGSGYKFIGPGIAMGAGIGALGFLSSPYKTIYKTK